MPCIEKKATRKAGKPWKKGSMRGKGGPDNANCEYRGVRQRKWGKWVAEIREPLSKTRLWLGSFATAEEAARAYDEKSRKLHGPHAFLNLPDLPPRNSDDRRDTTSFEDRNAAPAPEAVSNARPVLSGFRPSSEPQNPSPAGQFEYRSVQFDISCPPFHFDDPFVGFDPRINSAPAPVPARAPTTATTATAPVPVPVPVPAPAPAAAPVPNPCSGNQLDLSESFFPSTAPPLAPLEDSDQTGSSASGRGGWEDADTAASFFNLDDLPIFPDFSYSMFPTEGFREVEVDNLTQVDLWSL